LNRAWRALHAEIEAHPLLDHSDAIDLALEDAQREPDRFMWTWEEVGPTSASGIVDDLTYDWLPVMAAMLRSEGQATVVTEKMVLRANELARNHTGVNVGHTGSAGLAALLDPSVVEYVDRGQHVVVLFTGVERHEA
jgi:threonine synthase